MSCFEESIYSTWAVALLIMSCISCFPQLPGFRVFMIEKFATGCCLQSVLDKSFNFRDGISVGPVNHTIYIYLNFSYLFYCVKCIPSSSYYTVCLLLH